MVPGAGLGVVGVISGVSPVMSVVSVVPVEFGSMHVDPCKLLFMNAMFSVTLE